MLPGPPQLRPRFYLFSRTCPLQRHSRLQRSQALHDSPLLSAILVPAHPGSGNVWLPTRHWKRSSSSLLGRVSLHCRGPPLTVPPLFQHSHRNRRLCRGGESMRRLPDLQCPGHFFLKLQPRHSQPPLRQSATSAQRNQLQRHAFSQKLQLQPPLHAGHHACLTVLSRVIHGSWSCDQGRPLIAPAAASLL